MQQQLSSGIADIATMMNQQAADRREHELRREREAREWQEKIERDRMEWQERQQQRQEMHDARMMQIFAQLRQ
jgi:hypothetical protein